MKKFFFLIFVVVIASCEPKPKGTVEVIIQSETYKTPDDIFKLKKLDGDSTRIRLKVEKKHKVVTGKYEVSLGFYANAGVFYNEGTLTDTIDIKENGDVKIYLVGGDMQGIFASDPKIEVEYN